MKCGSFQRSIHDRKRQEFQKIVDRISDEWDYINDDLHYETETLKISA